MNSRTPLALPCRSKRICAADVAARRRPHSHRLPIAVRAVAELDRTQPRKAVAEPPEQIRIMPYLRNATPAVANAMDLARTCLVTHSAVSESVASQVRRGFVRQIRIGPGRKARVGLTPRNLSLTESIPAYSVPLKVEMDSLETGEKIRFLYVMLKIIRELQAKRIVLAIRLCLNYVHSTRTSLSKRTSHLSAMIMELRWQ